MPSTLLNEEIRALLTRLRPFETIVIADRGFPFWPTLQTIDLSLVDGIPSVSDVLLALQSERSIRRVWIAEEFYTANATAVRQEFEGILKDFKVDRESHEHFKQRVLGSAGLIRSADTLQYSNLVLEMD